MAFVDTQSDFVDDDKGASIFDCVNESYRAAMQDLLPPGKAWGGARRPNGTFYKLLTGLALEYSRVGKRAQDVLVEYHPGESIELLQEWENALGLPRCGSNDGLTLAERQQAAWDALIGLVGGPTKQFFTDLGIDLGFADIVITTFGLDLYKCNSLCNDILYGPGWAFVWEVDATEIDAETDELLMCTFEFWKPVHTIIKWNLHP